MGCWMLYNEKQRVEQRIPEGGKQDIAHYRLHVRGDLPRGAEKRRHCSARSSECVCMHYRIGLPLCPLILRSEPT